MDSFQAIDRSLATRFSELENLITNPLPEETDPKILEIHQNLNGTSAVLAEFSHKFDHLNSVLEGLKSDLENLASPTVQHETETILETLPSETEFADEQFLT